MKKNVIKDAVNLATNILNSLSPDKDWGIVNIALNKSDEFLLKNYPSIPPSFGYTQNETPNFMEDNNVTEGETSGWWYVGISKRNSQWDRIRPQEITLDDGIESVAQEKGYIKNNTIIKYYVLGDDWGPRRHGQMAILTNKNKLQAFIDKFSKGVLIDAPIDRKYWYANRQLQFRMTDGGVDGFDFSKAEISRKLFEAFYDLWKSDGVGDYAVADIAKIYKKLHHEDLIVGRIGEIVSNIRPSIINPKTSISKGIEWRSKRTGSRWIFKIHPLI